MFEKELKLDAEDKKHLQKHFDDILNGKVKNFVILGLNDETGEVVNHEFGHRIIINGLLHDAVRGNAFQDNERDKNESISGLMSKLFSNGD